MKPYNAVEAENFYKNYEPEPTIPIFTGARYQRGHGIGNIFSGLLKAAIPIVKKGALSLGKTALQTGVNIAKESLAGKDIRSSINDNLQIAGTDILNKSTKYLSQKNNKKRKHGRLPVSSKSKVKKKRPRLTHSDIFSQ